MTLTNTSPADHDDLAEFGYDQQLHRSLGKFASFAAGFSFVSILTTIFQLFGLGYSFGGPAFFWTWPVVFIGQFAVALCETGHALLLDCLSLETQNVALAGDAPVFFVCDTAKERTLAASAYNQRRAECESAARHFGYVSLRHVTPEQLEAGRDELPEHVYRRCRHVLSENARVHEAIAVMGRGAWERFGELLQASHASLRDDYEVSCDELNIMCELAMEHDGCLGARMVGAGFGGCAMAAVRREAVAGFAETVGAAYQSRTGLQPRLFAVQAAGGAAILPH